MFTDNLPNKLLSSCKSLKNLNNPQQTKSFDLSDLQFQLCSNFLKQTKQKLYNKQAELLTSSQQLINKFSQNKSYNLKDISATQDTTSFSIQSNDQDDVFSQSCKSMLILRKSKSNTCMRRTQNNFSIVLRQIRNKCSQKTYESIANLVEQNKKLKQRLSSIEKKQKQINKKQQQYQKEQQQIFMLKKKVTDYDKMVQDLNNQIVTLKGKLKQSEQIKKLKSPQQIAMPMMMEVQASLKLFLHQKEITIQESSKKLKNLYIEVQTKIQQPFSSQDKTCQKCCAMLRKIKGSIIKYRELMEAQAEAIETLYQKFKNKFK